MRRDFAGGYFLSKILGTLVSDLLNVNVQMPRRVERMAQKDFRIEEIFLSFIFIVSKSQKYFSNAARPPPPLFITLGEKEHCNGK